MPKITFEWDSGKDKANQGKHGISFSDAQIAFLDPCRVIARVLKHSDGEERYFCFGKVGEDIVTVRFTFRGQTIRIIGAGYWRKGEIAYEKETKIHG